MAKQAKDVAQLVTNQLVAALESGVNPWRRPWRQLGIAGRGQVYPHNALSGKSYRGINVHICMVQQLCAGYQSAGWLTYKQAVELGGNVRKGEKGTLVIFWKFLQRKEKTENGEEKVNTFPMMRGYTVFNVDQCENLPERITNPTGEPVEAIPDLADWVKTSLGCDVRHGGDRAFYSPSTDHIQMPQFSQFATDTGYNGTLLHEATHATGSKSRLDRLTHARFGSQDYAKEELVAEMGASMLCAALGLDYEVEHHASYLQSWLNSLKNDKRYIFSAASLAQKSVDYILQTESAEIAEAA